MDEALLQLHARIFSNLDAGTPESVHEAARLCLELPPSTSETHAYIEHALISTGFALEQFGDFDRAAAFYRLLMESGTADPSHRSNASFRYALIREQEGNHEESRAAYQLALNITPLPVIARVARRQLAGQLLRSGRNQDAIHHLQVLLADPELEEAARLPCRLRLTVGLLRTGGFDPEQSASATPFPPPGSSIEESTVGVWADAALELETAQHYALAREYYERLLEMSGVSNPVRINCHYRAGMMCEPLADWDGSFRHYRAALEAPPYFPAAQVQARYRLSELLYLCEDYEPALEHLAALRTEEELNHHQRLEAHFRYATSLLRLGQLDAARREFEACRDRAATSGGGFDVKSELSLAELFEGQKDFASARKCYHRIIRNPTSEPFTKAAALARMEQLQSA